MLRRLEQPTARLGARTAATPRPHVFRGTTVAPQPVAVGRGIGAPTPVARPSRSAITVLASSEAAVEAAATPTPAPLLFSYKLGDVIEGTVKSMEPYGAFIHLDNGVFGLLHASEISRESITSIDTILAKGDKVKAMVMKVDGERKRLSLSMKRLEPTPGAMVRDKQLVFDKAEETAAAWMLERTARESEKAAGKEATRAAQLARMNAMVIQVGDMVEGTVQSVQPYGVFLNIGNGTVGLLHVSEISAKKITNIDMVLRKGDKAKAVVLSMDAGRGLSLSTKVLETTPGDMLRDKELVFSMAEERAAARRAGGDTATPRAPPSTADLQGFKVGDIVEGSVKTLQKRSVEVDLGNGASGFLGLSDIFHPNYTSHMYVNEVLREGDSLKAVVKAVEQGRGRVVLSTRMLVPKPDLQGFKFGDVVEGTVTLVRPSLTRVVLGSGVIGTLTKETLASILHVGDAVKATVVAVDNDLGRLTLSTKAL